MSSARRVAVPRISLIGSPAPVSSELVRACAAFGVLPEARDACAMRAMHTPEPADAVVHAVQASGVVQITGRSGAGKSSLIRALCARLGTSRRVHLVRGSLCDNEAGRAVLDLFVGDWMSRVSQLAHAGLAEPRLWACPAGQLSVGEQARLRLALAMQAARRGDVVIADEFGSTIDRLCAQALARTAARWARQLGVTMIVASAHEDLESLLGPDRVIDAATQRVRDPIAPAPPRITIGPGTIGDYKSLEHLHYRGKRPGTPTLVLRAMRQAPTLNDQNHRVLAGVLVVSMPTLNGAWRARAWPGFFASDDKRHNARRLNRHLRVISRVVVASHSRGLGIATDLVRAYLREPLSAGTEAVASMGPVCPFFARAGMVGYDMLPDRSDTRLLDALDHLGLCPEDLPSTLPIPGSLLHRELRTWARARKLLRGEHPDPEDIRRLIPLAVCRLCSRPRAYAFVKGEERDENEHDASTTAAPAG